MTSSNSKVEHPLEYTLSGGSAVTVIKPFGKHNYAALINLNSHYPESGKIAQNDRRDEYLMVLEGEIKIFLNKELYTLCKGDGILIPNNSLYQIKGKAKCIVLVKDKEGGKTLIQEEE